MKIAVMQPYAFPYIGYFQLINSVDKFIFYDDVNFIKRGWINRNRILVNRTDYLFAIPLQKISQNILIKQTLIHKNDYVLWKDKFLQTVELNYKKAPYFEFSIELLKSVLDKEYFTISELAINSIQIIARYLGITTDFIISSESYQNRELGRKDRLIDICKYEDSNHYINALGGQSLYIKEEFLQEEIKLNFLKTLPIEYKQFKNEFVPWLSIIDVLMFNSREEIAIMLNQYELA